jgi:hypothetical protein
MQTTDKKLLQPLATSGATDNTADNKCETIVAIETPFEWFGLAHKSAPSFTVIGERCKEALLLGVRSGLRRRSVQFCDFRESVSIISLLRVSCKS